MNLQKFPVLWRISSLETKIQTVTKKNNHRQSIDSFRHKLKTDVENSEENYVENSEEIFILNQAQKAQSTSKSKEDLKHL